MGSEMCIRDRLEADGLSLGAGYMNYRTNRLDPTGTIDDLRGAPADDVGRSVSEVVRQITRENLPLPSFE